MNAIQQWFDGDQDYEAGRLLYDELGENRNLKRTLSHGPTNYNWSALREELTKLLRAGKGGDVVLRVVPVASLAPAHVPVATSAPGHVHVATAVQHVHVATPAPATQALLLDLEKQWKPLYKEASYLQSQLEHAKDNQERGTWSHRILDLMEEVEKLWAAGAYVQEHGQLPPVAEVVPPPALDLSDRAAVTKRRNNLRANVSKQQDNAERAAEVTEWKAEITQLTQILTALDREAKAKQKNNAELAAEVEKVEV